MKNKAFFVATVVIACIIIGVSLTFIIGRLKPSKVDTGTPVVSDSAETDETEEAEPNDNVPEYTEVETTPELTPRYNLDENGEIILPEASKVEVVHAPNLDTKEEYTGEDAEEWSGELLAEMKPLFSYLESSIPVDLYISSKEEMEDGRIEVVVCCRNTDIVCVAHTADYATWDFYDCCNKYGSDYSTVYWNNGVPDNSKPWYTKIFELGTYIPVLTTDYNGGNTGEFLDVSTGQSYTLTLE